MSLIAAAAAAAGARVAKGSREVRAINFDDRYTELPYELLYRTTVDGCPSTYFRYSLTVAIFLADGWAKILSNQSTIL
jgi:hypothetical protein